MRLHRFFIPGAPIENEKEVRVEDTNLIHQLKKVFRYEVGDNVIILDNYGWEFLSEIKSFSKDEVVFTVLEKKENTLSAPKEIYLYTSVIKKDNFEWILQKGTELGVSYFFPILSERSEKKELNLERGEKIIQEAVEQSGWGTMPKLMSVASFDEAINNAPSTSILFHPSGKPFTKELFAQDKTIGIFIGPEGGWSDAELEKCKQKGIEIYSLGEQTLRAETAAIAVCSLFLL